MLTAPKVSASPSRRKAQSWAPRPKLRQRPVAVVIGSGFGGLAAAIRLSVKGYEVKVFEKLDAPGGRAYVHHQDGFIV